MNLGLTANTPLDQFSSEERGIDESSQYLPGGSHFAASFPVEITISWGEGGKGKMDLQST